METTLLEWRLENVLQELRKCPPRVLSDKVLCALHAETQRLIRFEEPIKEESR
jgi:hypothetical protein